jgi:hypothetical protein
MVLANNHWMRRCSITSLSVVVAACLVVACKAKQTGDAAPKPAAGSATGSAVVDDDDEDNVKGPRPIETVREKMRQVDTTKPDYEDPKAAAADKDKPKDAKKGDREDSEWVPAENKKGAGRWKDTGVYLDGKPIGFLQWGELPIGMPVVWFKDKVSANKRPGTDDPGWRWAYQRMYRFTDYLKTMGIDVKQVKEMHVYGPKLTSTLIVTGKDLQSKAAENFYFRFGSNIGGKAIPSSPGQRMGNNNMPDKIASVMIYIKKKPPKLVPDVGMVMDGETDPNPGVPYFGEPIRGGVRVYLDNKLAAIIKRQELDVKLATTDKDGTQHWKLLEVLQKLGVDTKKAAEMWVVRNERRSEKFTMAELESMTFSASAQAKGGVLLGDKNVRANVIAFHSRALKDDELPKITQDDE